MRSAAVPTRPGGSRRRAAALAAALAVLAAGASPALAAKTDILVLRNGDTVTGEVTELDRGRLTFKTDDAGTLAIEWDKVGSVMAGATFEVVDVAGHIYFGSLRKGAKPGEIVVVSAFGDWTLDAAKVVAIQRLGATFWKRLDGSIDAGISYTSSSELLKIDLAARVVMTRPAHEVALDGESTMTRQTDVEDTRRNSLTLSYGRRFTNRWVAFAQGQLEQNNQLGVELRGSLAAGGGRYLVQGRRDRMLTALGLRVNRETPLEGETTTNLEAALVLAYDLFTYDFPKMDLYVDLAGYASLSDWGRTRLEADFRIKRELLRDFSVSFRVYESYDSRPATEGADRHDFGAAFALGWTF
jgi:hypothetical protein